MLRRWRGCQAALRHASAIIATTLAALDPAAAPLRAACLHPASLLLRDMQARLPQVALRADGLRVVVAAAKLAPDPPGGAGGGGAAACIAYAQAGCVFEMAGAAASARPRVLLLPLLQPPAAAAKDAAAAAAAAASGSAAGRRLGAGITGSTTLTRAEAAMFDNWFGHQSSAGTAAAAGSAGAPSDGAGQHNNSGVVEAGVAASHAGRAMADALAAGAPVYPVASAADTCVLAAPGVLGSWVAAAGMSPSGDCVAVLLPAAGCLVVWRLAGAWGHRAGHYGRGGPLAQLPYCYLPVEAGAGLPVDPGLPSQGKQDPAAAEAGGGGGSGNGSADLSWGLHWGEEGSLQLLQHGQQRAAWEVWHHSS
jgi:hypothetical protein